ncbi:Betaine--homocysteine S-methyltransferase 1 [Acropora cervicornis]|uniref:Betaine--homocysteine S-methyltransferase 1 n=1 Tax=Acropora cervicornis TaxID=6130 RepID=A0AAD9V436_ACRCE|nr:Betaine--homocysteine S-methyltransferase 1 [Acropora cervicornis]
MDPKKMSVLDYLNQGNVLVGDGGMTYCLEKRGYVKAGPWTPECTVEDPDAVRQLHREFLRAGADVIQAFSFSMDDKTIDDQNEEINQAACDLAKGVAQEGGVYCAGSICQTASLYAEGAGKECVQKRFEEQIQIFLRNDMDLLIAEFFEYTEEAEWVVEILKSTGIPSAITMAIGPFGDSHNVPVGECAVRLARKGADIIGVNCKFDPTTSLRTLVMMREALDREGLNCHLMIQPVGYHTPDAARTGFSSLPELPFALEPRTLTRWDVHKYARQAYDLGVRYIGGCCGFEPYHIRAIAEELSSERGFLPEASKKHALWGEALKNYPKEWVRNRANRAYWENLEPATGRPYSSAVSRSDGPD